MSSLFSTDESHWEQRELQPDEKTIRGILNDEFQKLISSTTSNNLPALHPLLDFYKRNLDARKLIYGEIINLQKHLRNHILLLNRKSLEMSKLVQTSPLTALIPPSPVEAIEALKTKVSRFLDALDTLAPKFLGQPWPLMAAQAPDYV
ncbi:MAG: hypothetical protein L6R40_008155 [Gallowayella cf. fulva]|nr:MAG: hypothetical protein L6R40_008155 [Xanthomendoza cf. fulva]